MSLALQMAAIYIPFLQEAFSTVSLSLADWLRCLREACGRASQRILALNDLARQSAELADMDFSFLFDAGRDLFSIGFNVGERRIDPSFYDTMERRLRAPGDFAQAYVLAHEVGHHVQSLIGAREMRKAGEDRNQTSVRLELQADCLAGVWGHTARASLSITDEDMREALTAAHNIGDDALGHRNTATFTHGSSQQRMRWFKQGFDSGDARRCDTFAAAPGEL